MKLEKLSGKILVWTTGRQTNEIEYDSEKSKSDYSRRRLSYVENFLRENGEFSEADLIKTYMGKTLKFKEIPQLIPTGNYRINTRLGTLNETIERYVQEYGLDLNPDFQRHHVWNLEQRIAFVEFILQGGKTNPIYFNHTSWMKSMSGEMVVVDGKQRLTAMLMFLNNEFPVFKKLDSDGVGFFAKEFDHAPADIEIVINDLPTKKQVLKWYLQMNKGNVAHTENEIRKVEMMLNEV